MDTILQNEMHHCIFEINTDTKKYKFVSDFCDDYTSAEEFCQSMNNFRTANMPVYFCVRLLDQNEFENISNYNPLISAIQLKLSTSKSTTKTK